MLHILSLTLLLLCQVHNLIAAEEDGGTYRNAARSSDLTGDKICCIYNRKQLANEQIYSFKTCSNEDAVTCMYAQL